VAAIETPEPVAEVAPPVVEAVAAIETPEPVAEEVPTPELEAPPSYMELPPVVVAPPPEPVFELRPPEFDTQEPVAEEPPPPVEAIAHAELPFWVVEAPMPAATLFEPPAESAVEPEAEPEVEPAPAAEPSTRRPTWAPRMPPATVLSMSRNPIRSTEFQPPPIQDPTMSGLDRLLRVSAARGASTLYLSTDAQPSVRVDGELQTIEGEPVLSARDVESLLLTLMPERSHEALRTGAATEWFCDIDIVGRVRCLSFRDHRGPGGVFRLMPTRSVSVDQLGLPRSVQALAIEPEGLVLVAGPRSSGKRTLLSAFVDQINKTRRDHVITIEREVNIVHEQSSSFVSQREVRGNDDDMLVAARAALREDPGRPGHRGSANRGVDERRSRGRLGRAAGGGRVLRAHGRGRHRSHHRSLPVGEPSAGTDGAGRLPPRRHRAGPAEKHLRWPRPRPRSALEHASRVECDCGREDLAAVDGD
jgi:hypothetical protein